MKIFEKILGWLAYPAIAQARIWEYERQRRIEEIAAGVALAKKREMESSPSGPNQENGGSP